jgi:hypothetical protein
MEIKVTTILRVTPAGLTTVSREVMGVEEKNIASGGNGLCQECNAKFQTKTEEVKKELEALVYDFANDQVYMMMDLRRRFGCTHCLERVCKDPFQEAEVEVRGIHGGKRTRRMLNMFLRLLEIGNHEFTKDREPNWCQISTLMIDICTLLMPFQSDPEYTRIKKDLWWIHSNVYSFLIEILSRYPENKSDVRIEKLAAIKGEPASTNKLFADKEPDWKGIKRLLDSVWTILSRLYVDSRYARMGAAIEWIHLNLYLFLLGLRECKTDYVCKD